MAQRPSDLGTASAIPLLEDLVVMDTPESKPAPAATPVSQERNSAPATPQTRSLPRNNPFLPYEHLEQLARERAEFQRQFMQFALNQKPVATGASAARSADKQPLAKTAPTNAQEMIVESLARQLTQDVIRELRPQIEQRIRELLTERLGDLAPAAKS